MEREKRTPDDIWRDDCFGRLEEANSLIAYIESVSERLFSREDKKAFTLAIDANYGQGKTFFLKRLAEQIALNHPVATVDAWADDLADQPLTALVATLEEALEPYLTRRDVAEKLGVFLEKTGKVARLVAIGLVRRGLGLLVTAQAVDAAAEALSDVSDDVDKSVKDSLKDVGQGVAADLRGGPTKSPAADLAEQVAEFRKGQKAISDMKESLSAIVKSLDGGDCSAPIFILIDELDRCRPTYAIKLLEEIKHLFDVPGLVFVLAINADQLGHSVCHAYGSGFAGRAYLKRFIDREYKLAEPDLGPLLKQLWRSAGLEDERFDGFPIAFRNDNGSNRVPPWILLAHNMRLYGLSARDSFALIDMLQTAQALCPSDRKMLSPYLFPLMIGALLGKPRGVLPEPVNKLDVVYYIRTPGQPAAEPNEFENVASAFLTAAQMNDATLTANKEGHLTYYAVWSQRQFDVREQPIWAVERYADLIRTVSRFSNPNNQNVL